MLDFGIEIEFHTPDRITQQHVADALTAAGVTARATGHYNHRFEPTSWKVMTDGSIHPGSRRTGHELVSPPLRNEAAFETIKTVCTVLEALDAQVNKSCGLHVHIGARRHGVGVLRKLADFYVQHEHLIDQLVPPSRRGNNNSFCLSNKGLTDRTKLARATTVEQLATAVQGSTSVARRVKINFHSMWKYGTVEFRHHSGTVKADRIIAWVKFCTQVMDVAEKEANTVATEAYSAQWRRGRRNRVMFRLLTRPEGVTTEEVRRELGVRNRPSLLWHLEHANAEYTTLGRRGGFNIYKILPTTTAPSQPAATLIEMLEKLALTPEDQAFWKARAERLAGRSAEPVAGAQFSTTGSLPTGIAATADNLYQAIHGEDQ